MILKELLNHDARISEKFRLEPERRIWWAVAVFFAHSGDSWFWLPGLLILFLAGNPDWRYRALILAVSIVVQAVLVLLIKFSIRRSRPQGEWGTIYRNTDPHSFPSGHATRAALLVIMAFGLGPEWFGWLLLFWLPLVAVARVAMGVHFISDIIAGLLLGAGFGLVMLQAQPVIVDIFIIISGFLLKIF